MVVLHLVRHGEPHQDPQAPPWEWVLAPAAAMPVMLLRRSGVLPLDAVWVSSPEPKAASTARLLTEAVVRHDDDLREAFRDGRFLGAEIFQHRVLASFADLDSPAADRWEPLRDTRARMLRATQRAIAGAAGRNVVLVGHGTALTLLVSALTDCPPDVVAWQRMLMPDYCRLTWPGEVTTSWGHW